MFFTGNAGTGKSTVLKEIINRLQRRLGEEKVAVTASSGTAAQVIGGQTLHSWGGVGLAKQSRYQLLRKVQSDKDAFERWKNFRTLVLDELSMVDAPLFDSLEYICRSVKGNNKPFVGIQLILSGEFNQLPPVVHGRMLTSDRYCFKAKSWYNCIPVHLRLQHVWRQSETSFLFLLEEVKKGGRLSKKSLRFCKAEYKTTLQSSNPKPEHGCTQRESKSG